MPSRPGMIPLRKAAEMIGCTDDTARSLAYAGKLKYFTLRPGGWMQVDRKSVERFLAACSQNGKSTRTKAGKGARKKK